MPVPLILNLTGRVQEISIAGQVIAIPAWFMYLKWSDYDIVVYGPRYEELFDPPVRTCEHKHGRTTYDCEYFCEGCFQLHQDTSTCVKCYQDYCEYCNVNPPIYLVEQVFAGKLKRPDVLGVDFRESTIIPLKENE